MSRTPSTLRLLTGIAAGLLCCFMVQGLAYYVFDYGTGKTESNYFSTISRFQGAVPPNAEVALVGSSISGRLPGRESGNRQVSNLGSDGGSPLDGLSLLNEGLVGRPKWVVMETNTMFSSVGFAETPALAGAREPWFKIGGRFPLVGAAARPSGMLYGRLLGRKRPSESVPFTLQQIPSPVPEATQGIEHLPALEQERVKKLGEGLLRIQASGTNILIVRYPAGPMDKSQLERMNAAISWIHQQTGAPYLDLDAQIPHSQLEFTDSVHLGPASAARLLATIREASEKLGKAAQ